MLKDLIRSVVIVPPESTIDSEDFRVGWFAGYNGEPVDDGASEIWRDAHATGVKRRAEGW